MHERAPLLRERPSGAVHASWTGAWENRWFRSALISLAAGLFMAHGGAFGTAAAPFLTRVAYWVGLLAAGSVLGVFIADFARRGLPDRPWASLWVTVVAIAVPYTAIVWAVTWLTFGGHTPSSGRSMLPGLVDVFPPVLAVSAVMAVINVLAMPRSRLTRLAAHGDASPRFLERLPAGLKGAQIYAVESQDHYLKLHTSKGSDLILMRLSDAVAELEGLEGAQTHRSWWVAKAAVMDVRRRNGRATLTLTNGIEAPVSRAFARSLREDGWY